MDQLIKYFFLFGFALVTFYLSYLGMKKTTSLAGFCIGNKDMPAWLVGMTMAASISSTATFVINPGFVYVHGLSAYIHYGVAASLGIICAFMIVTKGFLSFGGQSGALTIPSWVDARYQHKGLRLFFAVLNLLSVTFVVLILVGCSLLVSELLPLTQKESLLAVLLFVFGYVLMGGTYAHAYTNSLQGLVMLIIAMALFISGLHYFDGGMITQLSKWGADYAGVVNPQSNLYYSFFSTFVSGFVITFALMFQPHILTKVLYLKNEEQVKSFLITVFTVGIIFSLMLFIGFYAKLAGLEVAKQDTVVVRYITHLFQGSVWSSLALSFVTVSLLAAGMSTLDGILVSLSSMVVYDLVMPFYPKIQAQRALNLSRLTLVIIGLMAYALAYNPPALVGLFAQRGVYAIAAASFTPIVFGVLWPKYNAKDVITSLFLSLGLYFYLTLIVKVANPAICATYAIFLSLAHALLLWLVRHWKKESALAAGEV